MADAPINAARMALMQTEVREPYVRPVAAAPMGGAGRNMSRRNNGRGRNTAGASGENFKALGKMRDLGGRYAAGEGPDVVVVAAAPPAEAPNGFGKRKRWGNDDEEV